MTESRSDRWLSLGMSVLLHGTLIGLLVFGWWHFREKAPPPTLSIDATVVNPNTLKDVGFAARRTPESKPKPQPAPVPAIPQGPPTPTPQEQTLRSLAAEAEQQHQLEAEQEQARRKAAKEAQAAAEQAAEQARQAAKAKKEARAQAQRKAEQQAEAKRKAEARKLAEAKKRAEEKKKAQELKLAAERAAQEKAARAAALAELRHNLQQEEQSDAATQAAVAGWSTEVRLRVEAAWIKPSTARSSLKCTVAVTLLQGGGVTNVSVGECNGDEAVRESIVQAVYRAAPLPPPPDPSLYNQQLNFVFQPQ